MMQEDGQFQIAVPEDTQPPGRHYPANTYLKRLLPHLGSFGLSRLADVTGLDRVGIPVVQAIRPLARSNAVNQGKGLTLAEAAVASTMEALETYAGEHLDPETETRATPSAVYGTQARERLSHHLFPDANPDWAGTTISFVSGTELLSGEQVLVPAALVSTDYTPASEHALSPFMRTTTGLGGGATADEALTQALFETLERLGTSRAMNIHGFFEKHRFDCTQMVEPQTRQLLERLAATGLLCTVHDCPSAGGFPVVWARLLDAENSATSLPFPADGFACRGSVDGAVRAAILEAIQTRASVIAGSREDITWEYYPRRADAEFLAFERAQMSKATDRRLSPEAEPREDSPFALATALKEEGLTAVSVRLMEDTGIPVFITRVVTLGIPGAVST
ncbi:YcaO-like family protein [uncultured Roseibium sp.]|uniref:YcaO-like family protein n=1 Tax=uncultured Roseibium sp. TaxID=1936171 RepID=UPI0026035146|nr:YcaO-like family protein [uncultured Roseibium sp.]